VAIVLRAAEGEVGPALEQAVAAGFVKSGRGMFS